MGQRYSLSEPMQRFVQQSEAFFPQHIVAQGIVSQRRAYDRMAQFFAVARPASLVVSDERLGDVPIRRYRPERIGYVQPILFVHGGGWYLGSLESHDSFCASLAHDCRVEVISVDYRLAPEHPYPAGLDDVTTVYRQLQAQGIKPLLMGDSAGGNLVAALALRCRRYAWPVASGQVLIYPALAAPDTTVSARNMTDAPLLDRDSMRFCWQVYSAGHAIDADMFPLLADDFSELPETAVFAAEFDPLIDDARLYVDALQQAGVRAACFMARGMVHGGLRAVSLTEEGDELYYAVCEQVQRLLRRYIAAS